MEETPTHKSDISHSVWPQPELGVASGLADRVGYEVQPEAPAPPSTKKLDKISRNAGHMNQYEPMFSRGNAMSLAPIISGIRKLPKAPVSHGMITKKIMIVACMLKAML